MLILVEMYKMKKEWFDVDLQYIVKQEIGCKNVEGWQSQNGGLICGTA